MSKEAIVIQKYNDMTREYQYSVRGYDITESIKNLLKLHKEAYDKENHSILETKGWLEAQKFYEEKIKHLEHQLSNCIEPKFKIGQEVWTIKIKKLAELKIENICYGIDHIIRYRLKDSKCFLFRCEHEIFATKEEAKAKLRGDTKK